MARKRKDTPGATPEKMRRLTAPVPDPLFRRVGAFVKYRGLKLGDVVQAALEAHLRGFYFVDRERGAPGDPAADGDAANPDGGASPPAEAVPEGVDLTAHFWPEGPPSPGAGEGSDRRGRRRAG